MLFLFLGGILATLILGWLGVIPRFVAGGLLVIFAVCAIVLCIQQISLTTGIPPKTVSLMGIMGVAGIFLR